MIARLENAQAVTDIDLQNFNIKNLGALSPVPPTLVASSDPRLSDPRVPLAGSVVDASVSLSAAILQQKINFNGQIPATWLGTGATQAAKGSLAEYVANKGQPGGYPSLDGTGKVPAAQMPTGAGTGTVTSVGLTPPSFMSVAGSPIAGSGVLAMSWSSVPSFAWFGNPTTNPGPPTFQQTTIPTPLIPRLDASWITSGVFALGLIPTLPASQIGSGTFALSQIPLLPASQISSGVFALSLIPALPGSQITSGAVAPAYGGVPPGGSAGQTLSKIDGISFNAQWISPPAVNALQTVAATPTGTASASPVMMGLAVSFSPSRSGRIVVIAVGDASNSVAGANNKMGINYGTGVAPINGAAGTGSIAAAALTDTFPTAGGIHPFTLVGITLALTVGTTYWFDLMLAAGGGGTASLSTVQFNIFEL